MIVFIFFYRFFTNRRRFHYIIINSDVSNTLQYSWSLSLRNDTKTSEIVLWRDKNAISNDYFYFEFSLMWFLWFDVVGGHISSLSFGYSVAKSSLISRNVAKTLRRKVEIWIAWKQLPKRTVKLRLIRDRKKRWSWHNIP